MVVLKNSEIFFPCSFVENGIGVKGANREPDENFKVFFVAWPVSSIRNPGALEQAR